MENEVPVQEGEVINISREDLGGQAQAPKRTIEDVRKEYTEYCNSAGQLSYQIKVMERDLEGVMAEMSKLNLEASKLAKEESNG
jgi:hypothetical protein